MNGQNTRNENGCRKTRTDKVSDKKFSWRGSPNGIRPGVLFAHMCQLNQLCRQRPSARNGRIIRTVPDKLKLLYLRFGIENERFSTASIPIGAQNRTKSTQPILNLIQTLS